MPLLTLLLSNSCVAILVSLGIAYAHLERLVSTDAFVYLQARERDSVNPSDSWRTRDSEWSEVVCYRDVSSHALLQCGQ